MSDATSYKPHGHTAAQQLAGREQLYAMFAGRPMPDSELLVNLGLYCRSSVLAKLLFLDEFYRKVVHLPGAIMVFGTWWGQDVVVLHNLRAVHEPYNIARRVIGFDTFAGYDVLSDLDVKSDTIKPGAYHTAEGHEAYLDQLLHYHNRENVLGHTVKHELVAGDLLSTLPRWLEQHPETLIAAAYLDLALYEPTKAVLQLIKPRLVRGAVVAMDELNAPEYPGETVAFRETMGLGYQLIRSQFLPDRSFAVID
jgi:hypothetical protein